MIITTHHHDTYDTDPTHGDTRGFACTYPGGQPHIHRSGYTTASGARRWARTAVAPYGRAYDVDTTEHGTYAVVCVAATPTDAPAPITTRYGITITDVDTRGGGYVGTSDGLGHGAPMTPTYNAPTVPATDHTPADTTDHDCIHGYGPMHTYGDTECPWGCASFYAASHAHACGYDALGTDVYPAVTTTDADAYDTDDAVFGHECTTTCDHTADTVTVFGRNIPRTTADAMGAITYPTATTDYTTWPVRGGDRNTYVATIDADSNEITTDTGEIVAHGTHRIETVADGINVTYASHNYASGVWTSTTYYTGPLSHTDHHDTDGTHLGASYTITTRTGDTVTMMAGVPVTIVDDNGMPVRDINTDPTASPTYDPYAWATPTTRSADAYGWNTPHTPTTAPSTADAPAPVGAPTPTARCPRSGVRTPDGNTCPCVTNPGYTHPTTARCMHHVPMSDPCDACTYYTYPTDAPIPTAHYAIGERMYIEPRRAITYNTDNIMTYRRTIGMHDYRFTVVPGNDGHTTMITVARRANTLRSAMGDNYDPWHVTHIYTR